MNFIVGEIFFAAISYCKFAKNLRNGQQIPKLWDQIRNKIIKIQIWRFSALDDILRNYIFVTVFFYSFNEAT